MKNLTKKQIAEIEAIINRLESATRYLLADNVAVCKRDAVATTTLHYKNEQGKVLYEVAREYGSDLCQLFTATRQLKQFITPVTQEDAA